MFKKILLMVILAMSVVGCTAEDIDIWRNADRRAAERGETCYRRANGEYYCKDRYGNRTYQLYGIDEMNNGSLKTMNLKDRGLSSWGECVPVFSSLSILY